MKARALMFGTLTSPLARALTQTVVAALGEHGSGRAEVRELTSPLSAAEREEQVFTATAAAEVAFLQRAVRDGTVQLAVVKASDLAQPLLPELDLLCVPHRLTPFDAFLNREGLIMDEMEPGSRIGVLSLRARSQMQMLWPELRFQVLHGGVDRAMEVHLRRSEIEGLVLPAAVAEHLGIQSIVTEIYSPEFLLPGPGQGILVVLGRRDDDQARQALSGLHSTATAIELATERAFYRRMVSDQDLPVGALAQVERGIVRIEGSTGSSRNRFSAAGDIADAPELGVLLANQILSRVESFLDLLAADFPDGLPPDEDDDFDLDDEGLPRQGEPDDLSSFEDLGALGDASGDDPDD